MAIKKFDELSNDLEMFDKEKVEKLDPKDYDIVEILDVFHDTEDTEYGNASESSITMHSDLSVKQTKRGDIIWISALLQKKDTTSFNSPAVQGVLKVRVVDIYYGLQMLNKVAKK